MKIHALARAEYLMSHIDPIRDHLPDELRGERLVDINRSYGHVKHWGSDDIVMVAGYIDIAAAFGRRVVYVEHGAGQSYVGARPNAANYYHGGQHPENVVAYIGPRQEVIDAWGRPGFAAGSPVCDPYELSPSGEDMPVAAITFHWNGAPPNMVGVPEAGSAFEHYVADMPHIVSALRAEGWQVIGHGHPRRVDLQGFWERHGVEWVPDADEVRETASLLIADNTSLMFEMLYLFRDVIALNCPEYRRDVEHGLRFWEMAHLMEQVDSAVELIDKIPHLDELATWHEGIARHVYGKTHSDGRDGQRAAMWLTGFVSDLGSRP